MTIDTKYIEAFSIETIILDKTTGAPLSGGIVTFEESLQPGVLRSVWQVTNTSGTYTYAPLANPMILSSIGTFVDTLGNPVIPYFNSYDVAGTPEYYRVIVTSSAGAPQFIRDPVPFIPDVAAVATASSAFENEISNPQFVNVLFDTTTASTYVYNFNAAVSEVVKIAPDWDIIVSSVGFATVTVAQLNPAGTENIPTNPGTILTILSAGATSVVLRQRIFGSPNLWGKGFIAGSFVANTSAGTAQTLTMKYSQSDGVVVDQLISTGILAAGGAYAAHAGSSVIIPVSTSIDTNPNAYIDIKFDLTGLPTIGITSVMLTPTGATSVSNITYDGASKNRQIDYLFHYYQPLINFKPIPSMLVGWDFPLNPAQTGSTVIMNTMATTPKYIWDQTIGASLVGNINVVRNTVTGGIQATTANANEAFYFMQYLSGNDAKKILNTSMSSNISAWRTTAGGAVTVKVFLYRGSSAATFPILATTIGTVAASGAFTLTAASWTLIARGNLGEASGVLSIVDTANYLTLNNVADLPFSGWKIVDATQISDTDKFAMVVTYSCPTTATVITTDSISLVPGDIPTRPAPQTIDQVLRECQYYYSKSFITSTTPAQNVGSGTGEAMGIQAEGTGIANSAGVIVRFNVPMRATPNPITLYNPAAANAFIRNEGSGVNWTATAVGGQSRNGFNTEGTTNGSIASFIGLHWSASAQLGIV